MNRAIYLLSVLYHMVARGTGYADRLKRQANISQRGKETGIMGMCIKVYYVDGTTEDYYGDVAVGDSILSVFPQDNRGMSIKIPLSQIKKYEIER